MKLELVDPNGTIKTCVLLVIAVLYIAVTLRVLVRTYTHSAYPCKHVAHTRKTHAHEKFLNRIFQFFTTFSTITRKESCE